MTKKILIKALKRQREHMLLGMLCLVCMLCKQSSIAQENGGRSGTREDGWVINHDNSNHWSYLRLQTSNNRGWNIINNNALRFAFSGNGNHGDWGTTRMLLAPNGDLTLYNGSLTVNQEIYVNNGWLRVKGDQGLYFQDRGGGFHMIDDSWIRTYGNKNFYHDTGIMRTDGTFQVGPNGNRLVVGTNGNVGIGQITPGAKLDVNGVVRASGGFQDGSGDLRSAINANDSTINNNQSLINTNTAAIAGINESPLTYTNPMNVSLNGQLTVASLNTTSLNVSGNMNTSDFRATGKIQSDSVIVSRHFSGQGSNARLKNFTSLGFQQRYYATIESNDGTLFYGTTYDQMTGDSLFSQTVNGLTLNTTDGPRAILDTENMTVLNAQFNKVSDATGDLRTAITANSNQLASIVSSPWHEEVVNNRKTARYNGRVAIQADTADGYHTWLDLYNKHGEQKWNIRGDNGDSFLISRSNNNTNPGFALTINSNKRVGIGGVYSASEALEVAGNVKASGSFMDATGDLRSTISTNADSIQLNRVDIGLNQAATATNAGNITTNLTAIQQNDTEISNLWYANDQRILGINSNATNIAANTATIATLQGGLGNAITTGSDANLNSLNTGRLTATGITLNGDMTAGTIDATQVNVNGKALEPHPFTISGDTVMHDGALSLNHLKIKNDQNGEFFIRWVDPANAQAVQSGNGPLASLNPLALDGKDVEYGTTNDHSMTVKTNGSDRMTFNGKDGKINVFTPMIIEDKQASNDLTKDDNLLTIKQSGLTKNFGILYEGMMDQVHPQLKFKTGVQYRYEANDGVSHPFAAIEVLTKDHGFTIKTEGGEGLHVHANGNVGIGNLDNDKGDNDFLDKSEKLVVDGNVKAKGLIINPGKSNLNEKFSPQLVINGRTKTIPPLDGPSRDVRTPAFISLKGGGDGDWLGSSDRVESAGLFFYDYDDDDEEPSATIAADFNRNGDGAIFIRLSDSDDDEADEVAEFHHDQIQFKKELIVDGEVKATDFKWTDGNSDKSLKDELTNIKSPWANVNNALSYDQGNVTIGSVASSRDMTVRGDLLIEKKPSKSGDLTLASFVVGSHEAFDDNKNSAGVLRFQGFNQAGAESSLIDFQFFSVYPQQNGQTPEGNIQLFHNVAAENKSHFHFNTNNGEKVVTSMKVKPGEVEVIGKVITSDGVHIKGDDIVNNIDNHIGGTSHFGGDNTNDITKEGIHKDFYSSFSVWIQKGAVVEDIAFAPKELWDGKDDSQSNNGSYPVPDYVFAPDYKLRSLDDLKSYVLQNRHLPDIPSAQEVNTRGYSLIDMEMGLLKNIEELVLHTLEQENRLNAQQQQIDELKKLVDTLMAKSQPEQNKH